MPDGLEYRDAIQDAERGAAAGDFAGAESSLRRALDLQERHLGTAHPELASTLNNLAVVCETRGKIDDAEQLYRRAAAVASGGLPPGDPLVVTSRANLEDFCRAHGRALEDWPELQHAAPQSGEPPPGGALAATAPEGRSAAPTDSPSRPSARNGGATGPAAPAPARVASASDARGVTAVMPRAFLVALATLALGGTLALAWFARSSATSGRAAAEPPATADQAAAGPPALAVAPTPPASSDAPATPSVAAPPAFAAETGRAEVPIPTATATTATATDSPRRVTSEATPPERVVEADLCQPLVRRQSRWTCEAPAVPAAAGAVAFYTRVAAPRPVRVEHRWFHNGTLARTVGLSVGASPQTGYRTYSQQTVTAGRWRVEVRTVGGRVLHETSFDVR